MTAITGTSTVGTTISLTLFGTTTGTYAINGTTVNASYYNTAKTESAASGQIVISKIENGRISGTFNFVITGGVKATEGTFTDVKLQ